MAWNIKYYIEFRDDNNALFRLNIEEEDYAGGITELNSSSSPVEIITSEGDMIIPVVGAGLSVSLISAEPLQLIGLNTVDKFANRIELFKNSNLVWQGWLNGEEYQEIYSEYKNYVVSFTANDGLALLDDIKFQNPEEVNWQGLVSAFDVIKFIVSKTELEDIKLHISDDIVLQTNEYVDITHGATETYLHDAVVDLDNYVDELGEAMSCRTVLDGILQSLGLMLRNNVLTLNSGANTLIGYTIYDNNVIRSTDTITFKYYNLSGTYVGTWSLLITDNIYDLQNDLTYTKTNSTLNFTNSINKQNVIYSPYVVDNILNLPITSTSFEDSTVSSKVERSTASCDTDPDPDEEARWSEWLYDSILDYNMLNVIATPNEEVYGVDGVTSYLERGKDFFISTSNSSSGIATDLWFETTIDTPYLFKNTIYGDSSYFDIALLINFKIMVRSKVCYNEEPIDMDNFSIQIVVSIGDKVNYAHVRFGKEDSIIKTDTYYEPETNYNDENDDGKGVLIRFKSLSGGETIIPAGKVKIAVTRFNHVTGAPAGSTLRFKDFNAKVVADKTTAAFQYKYTEYSSIDVVNDANINPSSGNNGADINIIHGTNTTTGIERGQFMYESTTAGNYFNLNNISKGSPAVVMTSENWLLNKIFSNKYDPMVKLSNISVRASDLEHSSIVRITDVSQFPTKVFMIIGYIYKLYDNEIELILLETNKDYLTPTYV